MRRRQPPRVFFNASVILAGLASATGGSAKLLSWVQQKKIVGLINEIVFQEAGRHATKIGLEREEVKQKVAALFSQILPPPKREEVEVYRDVVLDFGDAHILASATISKSKFLVTLDKKHLLSLRKKIKKVKIISPGEFIELLQPPRR